MNSEIELLREVQDMMSEFENSRTLIDSLIPVVEELVPSFSAISKLVLVSTVCHCIIHFKFGQSFHIFLACIQYFLNNMRFYHLYILYINSSILIKKLILVL